MRSLFLSAVMLMTAFAAQAQQSYGIAYQAVARDADGDALENATLDVRFTLTDAADAAIWTETHNGVMTDEFGLINLTIGSVEGADGLASVDWAAGGFAFQVEVNSGDGFDTFGSMAVTSVPVALFAAQAPEPKADSLAAVTAQEALDRANADSGLQGQIDGNDTDIATNAGAISTNATAISDEASARETADSGLQGQIDGNDTDIATNAGAISTNATAISDEASARETADSGLQGQIDGNDTDIATNAGAISTNATAISDEAAARETADSGLQGQIDGNDTDIATNAGAISTNATAISDEASARETADSGLQGQIDGNDTDIATNAGAISTNATAISDEASARETADSGLQGQIDGNDTDIATNAGAISTNATAISDEATARAAADGTLQDNIDAEATARFNNDSFLSGMISANGVADAALDARVTALENESSTAALDAIDSLDTAHSAEILANTTALSTETSARIAADSGLQGQVDGNDTDIATNAAAISGNDTDIAANAAAISGNDTDIATNATNISNNYGVISANATAISGNDTDIAANAAAISGNDTDIAANAAAISGNDTDIAANAAAISGNDTDIAANAAAISGNDTDIAANAAAISGNDTDIATNATAISDEATARTNADADLQTQIDNLPNSVPSIGAVVEDMLDGTQEGAGLNADGSYFANGAANYISGATSLANADDLLDAAVKAVQDDVDQNESDSDQAEAALQTELDGTQTGAGLGTDGAYTANAAANHISAATSLVNADDLLDAAIKAVQDDVDGNETAANSAISTVQGDVDQNETDSDQADAALQTELDGTQTGAGLGTDGAYTANAAANHISAATSLVNADDLLDAAIKAVQDDVDGNETAANSAISTVQGDVDQNETDSDQADAALQTELDGTQTGAGLGTDGAYTANAAANHISAATSLVNADDLLDAAIKAVQDDVDGNETAANSAISTVQGDVDQNETDSDQADAALQTELDGTQTGAGLGTDGAYTANAAANHISAATSLVNADDLLDAAIKAVQDDVDGNETAANSAISTVQGDVDQNETDSDQADAALQTELDGTQTGAGLGTDGAYTANAAANHISAATSLVNADDLLDAAIKAVQDDVDGNETAANSAISTVQGDVDQNETDSDQADAALQTELDGTQTGAGLGTDGAYTANAAANHISAATSLVNADDLLDAAIKAVQDDVDGNETAANSAISTVQGDVDQNETDSDQADAALQTELDGTQTGAGLGTDGAYTANAAANHISAATSLVNADDLLDAAIKAVQDDVDGNETAANSAISTVQGDVDQNETDSDQADAALQTELDGTQTGAGLGTDGAYTANAAANHISAATSLVNADDLLDAAIKAVQDDVDGNETAANSAISTVQGDVDQNETDSDQADAALQTELDGTQTGAGLGTDGAYTANAAANYISAATSLVNADDLLDAQAKANADEIIATDYFDQTDVTLHAGAGETWTGIETANGSFTTGVSTGTMAASGNATVGGTLGVTGAATLSSTLGVTGATELDDALGVDGNVRIGASGASKFSVDAVTGTATLAGDVVALTGGLASGSLTITGSSTLQNVSASSLSVSGLITVPTPSLGSAAANKSYVDGAISTAVSAASAEAWSYKGSADCSFVNGYLVLDESDLAGGAETITVFGADLDAASTFALANEGNSLSLTPTVADGNSLSFDLTHAQAAALSSCTGDLYLHFNLIIDGKNSGMTLFIRVQA